MENQAEIKIEAIIYVYMYIYIYRHIGLHREIIMRGGGGLQLAGFQCWVVGSMEDKDSPLKCPKPETPGPMNPKR